MSRALEGFTVLDLSMNLPGPYMTWLLAQLGAEVIKIENPVGGDYARVLGGNKSSPFFAAVNRNKKSVALNLKHPEGRSLFLELVKRHDILIEGFRPGTMERLGLDFQATSAINPRLIHVSITGYGQNGPYRLRAGHDLNYLSLAGIIGMTGSRDGQPAIIGVQIADLAGGSLMGLSALLAAVVQRDRTGNGQFVDVSMFDGSLSLATMIFAGVEEGLEPARAGKMLLNGRLPCYGLYLTKDNGYMSLGALEFKFWKNFCETVGRQDLIGGQFGGPEVVREVQEVFSSRTLDEWTALMLGADACCEPVVSLDQAVQSPLATTRNMVSEGPDGKRYLASPLKMSGSTPLDDVLAPELGQHTREVLEQLGLGPEDFDRLVAAGVIG